MVICSSSITSNRADCVFGEALLISSASTSEANTGPFRHENVPVLWSYNVTPSTSDGSRSGVNWMRPNVEPIVCAVVRANRVFPVPGSSSNSRCPPANNTVSSCLIAVGLPMISAAMRSESSANARWNASTFSGAAAGGVSPLPSGLAYELRPVAVIAPNRVLASASALALASAWASAWGRGWFRPASGI